MRTCFWIPCRLLLPLRNNLFRKFRDTSFLLLISSVEFPPFFRINQSNWDSCLKLTAQKATATRKIFCVSSGITCQVCSTKRVIGLSSVSLFLACAVHCVWEHIVPFCFLWRFGPSKITRNNLSKTYFKVYFYYFLDFFLGSWVSPKKGYYQLRSIRVGR